MYLEACTNDPDLTGGCHVVWPGLLRDDRLVSLLLCWSVTVNTIEKNLTNKFIRPLFNDDGSIDYGSASVYWQSVYFVTRDGAALGIETVRDELHYVDFNDGSDTQWEIVGVDVNWESEFLVDDHTGESIIPAYGSDEDEEDN